MHLDRLKKRANVLNEDGTNSPLPYHISITTGGGSEQGHIADFHIRAQVHVGKNHKVRRLDCARYKTLTFPYSFMAHPEILLPIPEIDDPIQRFLSVVKFYLSGWHVKPPYAYHCGRYSSVGNRELILFQGGEEATQSYSWRNVHMLLGLPRSYSMLLHI